MSNKDQLSPRDQIKKVALDILMAGERPSQTSVRKNLKATSSNTTISKALDEFWSELAIDLQLSKSRPGVPDELFTMVMELWNSSLNKSNAIFEARKTQAIEREAKALDAMHDAEARFDSLSKKCADLETQLAEAKSLLNKQQVANAEQSIMLKNANKTIAAKDEEYRKLTDQFTQYRDGTDYRLAEKDDQISDLNRKMNESEKEKQQLTNSLSGARLQVMNLEKFKDLYHHEQQSNQELKANNAAVMSENRALSEKLIASQNKSDELRDRFDARIDEIMDEAKEDRKSHAEEISAITKTKVLLQEQHDSLGRVVTQQEETITNLKSELEVLSKS